MSVREYVGARYVPIVVGEWDKTHTYEPLMVVIHEGNSYVSRQYVPAGIDIQNEQYWIESANYNAQVDAYKKEVQAFDGRITANAQAIDAEKTRAEGAERANATAISAETTRATEAEQAIINIASYKGTRFATATAMKASNIEFAINDVLTTCGFYEVGDDGAATYVVTNDTPNGMNILALGNGLSATLVPNKSISFRTFGAYLNETDDETAATQAAIIQAVIDYAAANNLTISADESIISKAPILINKSRLTINIQSLNYTGSDSAIIIKDCQFINLNFSYIYSANNAIYLTTSTTYVSNIYINGQWIECVNSGILLAPYVNGIFDCSFTVTTISQSTYAINYFLDAPNVYIGQIYVSDSRLSGKNGCGIYIHNSTNAADSSNFTGFTFSNISLESSKNGILIENVNSYQQFVEFLNIDNARVWEIIFKTSNYALKIKGKVQIYGDATFDIMHSQVNQSIDLSEATITANSYFIIHAPFVQNMIDDPPYFTEAVICGSSPYVVPINGANTSQATTALNLRNDRYYNVIAIIVNNPTITLVENQKCQYTKPIRFVGKTSGTITFMYKDKQIFSKTMIAGTYTVSYDMINTSTFAWYIIEPDGMVNQIVS